MSITDPTQLVAEFKKSGEFDRLRRELLSQFRNDDSIGNFMSRVHDIVQQRLVEDERLQYLPPEAVHNELMQDMDRFPLVQRAVADLPALTDPSFSASIRSSLLNVLHNGPGAMDGKPAGEKGDVDNEDIDMDESEGSDSESFDDEREHEHGHGANNGLPGSVIPDGMPQNDRVRQTPGDLKHLTLVNGIQDSAADDGSTSASPDNTQPRENDPEVQQDS